MLPDSSLPDTYEDILQLTFVRSRTNTSSDLSKLFIVETPSPLLVPNALATQDYVKSSRKLYPVLVLILIFTVRIAFGWGATFMANSQAGNPNLNRLLKLQGRWKSDPSKDMYVQDSLESRLTLTKTLNKPVL